MSSFPFSAILSYFAQILEEHGPLEVSDPLLVGELKNFPHEALQKIEAAGGLKPFLHESLRFVMRDDVIALASHAVYFQDIKDDDAFLLDNFHTPTCSMDDLESKGSSLLNPSAKEFLPQSKHLALNDDSESYDHASCLVLPSPYDLIPQSSEDVSYASGIQDIPGNVKPDLQAEEYHDYFPIDQLNAFNTEFFSSDNNYIHFKEDMCPKSKTVFVQVRSLNDYFIVKYSENIKSVVTNCGLFCSPFRRSGVTKIQEMMWPLIQNHMQSLKKTE